jgi:capsular exopolysaccharide synthesis family protein
LAVAIREGAVVDVQIPAPESDSAPSFSVITAGGIPPNPSQLIESLAMARLLTELRETYDLVIVDTSPISVVSDAIPLMSLVDGVVIVSRLEASTRDAAEHVRDQLSQLGARTLGVVANHVSNRALGDSPYAYYGREYVSSNGTASSMVTGAHTD